jgi:hypothetical protein
MYSQISYRHSEVLKPLLSVKYEYVPHIYVKIYEHAVYMIYACKLYITTKQKHFLTILGKYLKQPAKKS